MQYETGAEARHTRRPWRFAGASPKRMVPSRPKVFATRHGRGHNEPLPKFQGSQRYHQSRLGGPAIRLRQHHQPQSVAKTRGTSVLRFEQACHMSTDADRARPHHHDASANAGRQPKERPLEAIDIGEPSAGHDAWPHAVDCTEFTRQSQRFGDSVKSLNRISWINLLAGQCWMR